MILTIYIVQYMKMQWKHFTDKATSSVSMFTESEKSGIMSNNGKLYGLGFFMFVNDKKYL